MNSAHTHKNLPIPVSHLKNRGSEMIGKKSKNRPINRDRRSDLAALVKFFGADEIALTLENYDL